MGRKSGIGLHLENLLGVARGVACASDDPLIAVPGAGDNRVRDRVSAQVVSGFERGAELSVALFEMVKSGRGGPAAGRLDRGRRLVLLTAVGDLGEEFRIELRHVAA